MAGPTLAIREQCPNATPANDGLMSAQYAEKLDGIPPGGLGGLAVYVNDPMAPNARPAAGAVGAIPGVLTVMIWNFDDKAPNFSDGFFWYDAAGVLT